MKYFVYYNDDYEDNGGIGLVICDREEDVCAFIEQRIDQNPTERTITDYRVIRGVEAVIGAVETTTKIKIR